MVNPPSGYFDPIGNICCRFFLPYLSHYFNPRAIWLFDQYPWRGPASMQEPRHEKGKISECVFHLDVSPCRPSQTRSVCLLHILVTGRVLRPRCPLMARCIRRMIYGLLYPAKMTVGPMRPSKCHAPGTRSSPEPTEATSPWFSHDKPKSKSPPVACPMTCPARDIPLPLVL